MDKIQDYIDSQPSNCRVRNLEKEEYKEIKDLIECTYPGVSLRYAMICHRRGISPYCSECGSVTKDVKMTCGYKCSHERQNRLGIKAESVKKRRKTCEEIYGGPSPSSDPKTHEKRINTMIEKYGAKVSDTARESIRSRAKDLNIKGRKTLKEKYGVDNPGQLPGHSEKCKATTYKRYGVEHYTKSKEYVEASKLNGIARYNEYTDRATVIDIILPSEDKLDKFSNPNFLLKFRCEECNKEKSVPYETFKWRIRASGTPCLSCSGLSKGSKKEQDVYEFIRSALVESIDVIRNDRDVLNGKELDIYIPELKLAFEFDGLYYHNFERAGSSVHVDKTNACLSLGITLIHIFEDEWDMKTDITKSRILSILGKTKDTLFARKCEIKSISNVVADEFLDNNHLQGKGLKAKICYGLYYNTELVSVMTFINRNKSRRTNEWELYKFCNKINIKIPGAASKLFSHFIKNNPDVNEVISYSDNRWSAGNLYSRLGFDFVHTTRPGYWYYKIAEMTRIHRFVLRKRPSEPKDRTEYELRKEQGYLKIYDCGNKKWKWTKK